MFVPFEAIAPSSRIWIYQSQERISAEHKSLINKNLTTYCEKWNAHGQALKASFDIQFDQFIIVAADESFNSTSGCSIDGSVRAIKDIEKITGLDFFNRNLVAFMQDESVFLLDVSTLKEKYRIGIWKETTTTFNNLISTKNQLQHEWIVPAVNTWLKRYVTQETIKT